MAEAAGRDALGDQKSGINTLRQVCSKLLDAWSRRFDDPIPLPTVGHCERLETPATTSQACRKPSRIWRNGRPRSVCLIGGAEGRDFLMHARIGVLKATNRDVQREFDPSRKDTHWGKRKLKRDE